MELSFQRRIAAQNTVEVSESLQYSDHNDSNFQTLSNNDGAFYQLKKVKDDSNCTLNVVYWLKMVKISRILEFLLLVGAQN